MLGASPRPRVLLVDDNQLVLQSLERVLRRLGYEVTSTTSPVAALERLVGGDRDFAALVLDVEMVEMRGPDLVARLELAGVVLPIVFLTGGAFPTTTHPVVEKPVSGKDLAVALLSRS